MNALIFGLAPFNQTIWKEDCFKGRRSTEGHFEKSYLNPYQNFHFKSRILQLSHFRLWQNKSFCAQLGEVTQSKAKVEESVIVGLWVLRFLFLVTDVWGRYISCERENRTLNLTCNDSEAIQTSVNWVRNSLPCERLIQSTRRDSFYWSSILE